MGLEPFTADDPIFDRESVLRDTYTPDGLVERDRELSEYQNALKPVIKGEDPKNIFLFGQTGVGKTIATEMILDRLEQDQAQYDYLDIKRVSVLCKGLNSSYQVAVKLVNEFRDPNDKIPPTGYAPDAVLGMLWTHLRKLDATHVLIVLDEIDSIGSDDDILYQLPRANSNGNVSPEKTKIGVIGISNDFTFRDNLSARVKDSLAEEEIHFPPYDANQLGAILKGRAEKAFQDGVLDDDVIPLCAAFAGQESGSARQALKLLYKAGDLARNRDDDTVTEEHVREAEPLVQAGKVQDELEALPTQSHLTLFAVLRLHEQNKLPAKSHAIYDEYTAAAKAIDVDVKTDRTIRDRLSQLSLKGFLQVDERNKGSQGGSYYLYDLNVHADLVRKVLKENNRTSELFEINF